MNRRTLNMFSAHRHRGGRIFLRPSVLVAVLGTALSLAMASAAASGSQYLVIDTFSGHGSTLLEDHVPDLAASNSAWAVIDGVWVVKGGMAVDNTRVKEFFAGDRQAIIDAGSADMLITAVMKRGGGNEFQGVVGRYVGPADWVMVFYDGTGDIVLGAKRAGEDAGGNHVDPASAVSGGFQELGRVPRVLDNGTTHSLSLSLVGEHISVHLDGVQILPVGENEITDGDHATATTAGIFLRGNGSSRFDEFIVTPG